MNDSTPRKSLGKLSLKRGDDTAASAKLEERLHKVLAQAGLGSRRALEQRIADGLVKVNGETAQIGQSIRSGDRVELDGKGFVASALTEPARLLIYNKPEGEVTTREDPEGRPTIFEALPPLKGARWIAIGRLDINTTGLLLLTTDGELANAMMHPSYEVEREYVCRVRAPEGEETVSDAIVDRLARGVALEDGPARFDQVERIGGTDSHDWFKVVVKEGRNREVRRLWESQGCQVSRLKRVRYGKIALPRELLRGQSHEVVATQVEALRKELALDDSIDSTLTLQPVIGQRRASKSTVHLGRDGGRGQAYVNGNNTADEGRELRRFDHVREDRRGGRGGNKKPHGGLTVSGEAAAQQSQKPFKQRKDKGLKPLPEGNPAAFRTWYVPDGVSTGPSGHRNAGPKKPYYGKSGAGAGAGGPGGGGQGQPRKPRPYGHPGNAPHFPSDHATPGAFPGNERGRGPRPAGGGRPGGGGPGAGRPGGGPGAGRPGGGGHGAGRPGGGGPGAGRPGGGPGAGRPGGGGHGAGRPGGGGPGAGRPGGGGHAAGRPGGGGPGAGRPGGGRPGGGPRPGGRPGGAPRGGNRGPRGQG